MSRKAAPLKRSKGASVVWLLALPDGEKIQFNESDEAANRLPMFIALQDFVVKRKDDYLMLRQRFGHLLFGYLYKLMQISDLPHRLEEEGNEKHLQQFAHFYGVAPDFTLAFMTAMRAASARQNDMKYKAVKYLRMHPHEFGDAVAATLHTSPQTVSEARKILKRIEQRTRKFKGFSVSPA
jgi:hypothetical protein